jgi:hypothetical protein
MARSERARLAAAVAFSSLVAIACAPRIPLEKLRCPCLAAEGYACCAAEQICYPAQMMPATCAPADPLATADASSEAGGGADGAVGPDAADAGDAGGSGGDASDAGAGGGGAGGGGPGGAPPSVDRAAVDGYFPAPPEIRAAGPWLFTTTAPADDWAQPGFDDTGWQIGQPGFVGEEAAPGDNPGTAWPEGAADLWLRTTFRIDAADVSGALFWGRWDDTIEVYVNGALAAPVERFTPGYRYLGLDARTLVPGASNTLAVRATDFGGGRYVDLAVALNPSLTALPTTGSERTPALAVYATTVRRFMQRHGIPGGALAVMKKDQVVVTRGFGWADKRFTRPMPADAVMRLGSPDVLLTAGAVRTLIDAGVRDPVTSERVTDDTRVFPLLRAHGLTALPGRTPAPEIDDVTVRMLLDGTSGISELPGDPARIYGDLGVAPGAPITAEDDVRWVYSAALAHNPGAKAGDGAAGFMVLRHVIHAVTGDLLGYLRDAVFAPAGTRDVFIAHEPLSLRDGREPAYLTQEAPSDRWLYLDNFTALATTTEAFVRYLRRYHATAGTRLVDPGTQQWAAVPDNGTAIVFGAMPGTWTVIVQRRSDQVSYAVFFNIGGAYDALVAELETITNGLAESDWGL